MFEYFSDKQIVPLLTQNDVWNGVALNVHFNDVITESIRQINTFRIDVNTDTLLSRTRHDSMEPITLPNLIFYEWRMIRTPKIQNPFPRNQMFYQFYTALDFRSTPSYLEAEAIGKPFTSQKR